MIRKFVEGDLLFEFDEELWRPLESWDKHAAYRTGIREVDKAKAVDFIGVYRNSIVFFIEVKDYRLHRRTNPESPWVEFEYKVRNTIAGLVGSGRREGYASVCVPFLDALLKPQELKLVYWVELPPLSQASSVIRKRHVATAGFAARQTGRLMKWLDARAFTVSQENDYERLVPGLKVKNLPRKRRELAEAVENRLRSRGINIGDGAKHRISQERDLEVLEDWFDRAATVSTAEELFGGYR
jgi:hypothetical protein